MTAHKPVNSHRGRKRGALDKQQRSVINAEIAKDILDVYNLLGGPQFLFKWAKENPSLFVNGPLARLMPAPPKEDADGNTFNTQINIDNMSDRECAMRIAYALAKAVNKDPSKAIEPIAPVVNEDE